MKSTLPFLIAAALAVPRVTAGASPEFEPDVRLFLENCNGCYSGSSPQASLDVRTDASLIEGGLSGPAIVPGIHARQLLLAGRLLERRVRFVHVLHEGQLWNKHKNNNAGNHDICPKTDRPTAALLSDLIQSGLIKDTLIIWGGKFGRTPMTEGKDGRDHHKFGFRLWMTGGGVKAGFTYGATDEFGYHAAEKPVQMADCHATVLHLPGIDSTPLTYRQDTRDEKLTDIHQAKVETDILS